jgi:hypothetical protein
MDVEPAYIQLDGSIVPRIGHTHANSLKEHLRLPRKKMFSFDAIAYAKLHKLVRVFLGEKERTGFELYASPSEAQILTMTKIASQYLKSVEISLCGEHPQTFQVNVPKYIPQLFRNLSAEQLHPDLRT